MKARLPLGVGDAPAVFYLRETEYVRYRVWVIVGCTKVWQVTYLVNNHVTTYSVHAHRVIRGTDVVQQLSVFNYWNGRLSVQ